MNIIDDVEGFFLFIVFIASGIIFTYGLVNIILLYYENRNFRNDVDGVKSSYDNVIDTINAIINDFKNMIKKTSDEFDKIKSLF